jgi:hypothetical protein
MIYTENVRKIKVPENTNTVLIIFNHNEGVAGQVFGE